MKGQQFDEIIGLISKYKKDDALDYLMKNFPQ